MNVTASRCPPTTPSQSCDLQFVGEAKRLLVLATALLLAACGESFRHKTATTQPISPPRRLQAAGKQYGLIYDGPPDNRPIVLNYDARFAPAELETLQRAVATWNSAEGSEILRLESAFTADTSDPRDLLPDAASRIYRLDKRSGVVGPGDLGLTEPLDMPKFTGRRTLLFLNFCDFKLTDALAADAPSDADDLETVVLHELGHVIGLDHVDKTVNAASIMLPGYRIRTRSTRRTPSPDDGALLRFLYGDAPLNPYEGRMVADDDELAAARPKISLQ